MFRRLLTCLAIITGLAAAGAPTHVAASQSLGVALELSQRADQPGKSETAVCEERDRQRKARDEKSRPCRPVGKIRVVIPTVMFGADRAYE
ncbi:MULTISPECIES: hypothetical protein [unclassified Erythrobacter]|jgi:hypothetical protein|uniref:hypothetical protein n=1 Tax=Erythrobacteraceae TaxID=335929 RepID=UPI00076CDBAE|nr:MULTISPECIES: hypothetical protein [unclassified Erythrobacter]KWV95807.1 hypothetical protein ASS64_00800 [Erythrobacter sp. AP23]MBO6768265.1 hypothetical protein [Erythrobacter sp.]